MPPHRDARSSCRASKRATSRPPCLALVGASRCASRLVSADATTETPHHHAVPMPALVYVGNPLVGPTPSSGTQRSRVAGLCPVPRPGGTHGGGANPTAARAEARWLCWREHAPATGRAHGASMVRCAAARWRGRGCATRPRHTQVQHTGDMLATRLRQSLTTSVAHIAQWQACPSPRGRPQCAV
jgi:hypothetical protein